MKAHKGTRDYGFKRRKFLHSRSTMKKFYKRYSNRRIRHNPSIDKWIGMCKMDWHSKAIIIQW